MKIPFPIKSTIDSRRSVRSYKMIDVKEDLMDEVKDYAKSICVPFDHNVEVRFFKANPTRALYTIMKSPPDNMAFPKDIAILNGNTQTSILAYALVMSGWD
ncbi:hypothetical protein JT739_00510 [Tepidanaerobacter sp. GT38]|uniref:hypothetical protein n=1 Tax=Tepidanaerobacter sp. GT38 TaxID=2722793 RepID=UPI001F490804|nr:hypothetical protein [Tepidanaerobacter sp. GT38]MCG1011079.1 hypothetical protein [Tepidanaerobacter sp. GT38]